MATTNDAIPDLKNSSGIENCADIDALLFEALINGTRASNSIPEENDGFSYFENIPEFQNRVKQFRERIVKLITDLATNVDSSDELFDLSYLRDADPSELEAFQPLANIIELLLENADSYLEEAKRKNNTNECKSSLTNKRVASSNYNRQVAVSKSELFRDVRAGLHGIIMHADIKRPQLAYPGFSASVDNSRTPFKHRLTVKPNALVPMSTNSFTTSKAGKSQTNSSSSIQERECHAQTLDVGTEQYSRSLYQPPYEVEVKAALSNPPTWLLNEGPESLKGFKPLDEVRCTWVDNEPLLNEMLSTLRGEHAIAIDLENHSHRSFQGFICLMQVSTREEDWLVDCIALHGKLECLNEIFTDSSILKVMHGANQDVLWLQRDFGIYLVSLFDTGRASRLLGYPSAGLAHSLFRHANVRTNKAYQLADWRIRPLTDDMYKYAREDTHYLLHMFDCMCRELRNAGGESSIRQVLQESADICLRLYEKPLFDQNSWKRVVAKNNVTLSSTQKKVLKAVYSWRDVVARREDESPHYVLPERMLVRIAKDMPMRTIDLECCCNPLPPVVQSRVTELLALVRTSHNSPKIDENSEELESIDSLTLNNDPVSVATVPISNNVKPTSVGNVGLNSSKSYFMPIKNILSTINPSNSLRGGENKRTQVMEDETNSRTTPSPVLTTEQLYDTAGWREVADSSWKASVIARFNSSAAEANRSGGSGSNSSRFVKTNPENENFQKAQSVKSQIGEEQLRGAFGVLRSPAKSSPDFGVGSGFEKNSATTDLSDDNMDVDTPADADALESEDIPRSIAEIFRISNRNRKRNKGKKKQGDSSHGDANRTDGAREATNDGNMADPKRVEETGEEVGSLSAQWLTKRMEEGDVDQIPDKNGNADDAVDFMRGISWVESGTEPKLSLLVEGAPSAMPPSLAGSFPERSTCGASKLHDRDRGGRMSSSTRGGYGRKPPSSPRRQINAQQSRYVFSNKNGSSSHTHNSKPSSGSFSYSQAVANSAGVHGGARALSSPSSTSKSWNDGMETKNQSAHHHNPEYRKGSGNVNAMFYSRG